ncbi:MAG: dethiobiotin synthase [Crocinitomicaceae bacterium]|nr:dethiobiotin synthase [Crocinitomicaceae bacterium]
MKGFAIAGIGTDVGKTIISAIVSEAIGATYFKPIQAGDLERSDRHKVIEWCSDKVDALPNTFALKAAMAPHEASNLENIVICLEDIQFPKNIVKPLVLEGAGGILVPLNEKGETILDLYAASALPIILVSRNYLGSINHTLLTVAAIQQRNIPIAGIIYTDEPSAHTEKIIEKFTKIKKLGNVLLPEHIDADFIRSEARRFSQLNFEL